MSSLPEVALSSLKNLNPSAIANQIEAEVFRVGAANLTPARVTAIEDALIEWAGHGYHFAKGPFAPVLNEGEALAIPVLVRTLVELAVRAARRDAAGDAAAKTATPQTGP